MGRFLALAAGGCCYLSHENNGTMMWLNVSVRLNGLVERKRKRLFESRTCDSFGLIETFSWRNQGPGGWEEARQWKKSVNVILRWFVSVSFTVVDRFLVRTFEVNAVSITQPFILSDRALQCLINVAPDWVDWTWHTSHSFICYALF